MLLYIVQMFMLHVDINDYLVLGTLFSLPKNASVLSADENILSSLLLFLKYLMKTGIVVYFDFMSLAFIFK